jgi:threonine aldolase
MKVPADRHEFASDNTAAICPEAWAELEAANDGAASSYGDDRWTQRVREQVRELFETDCEVFLVSNGTAANALALAQLCQSFHSIVCHENAHIQTDECGAPEFFSGGSKLLPTRGTNGKLDLAEVSAMMAGQPELHAPEPHALSITQATELGTVYTINELKTISAFAKERSLYLHMDGARFANAVASLNCAPKAISWQAGVDVLCFGGTKNGTGAGELVIFFEKELARNFDYRLKQGGQLTSKMRFLAAPWVGLLQNDVWLRNAQEANHGARLLNEKLRAAEIESVGACDANAVFVRMSDSIVERLHRQGWQFYKFIEPDIYRIMCSWSVTEKAIEAFMTDVTDAEESEHSRRKARQTTAQP